MRTVLTVDSLSAGQDGVADILMIKAERATIDAPLARSFKRLPLAAADLPPWTDPDAVRERGQRLRTALRSHPGLVSIFDHLAFTPAGDVRPLFLKLATGEPELIPWETLCDTKGDFLALDRRWPIGRVSEPQGGGTRPPAVLRLPVRLLAVISAYGIQGQHKEWLALEKAIDDARAAGLPLQVRVLAADPTTCAAVQATAARLGANAVALSGIDITAARVLQDMVAWAPNIVHFFCHGHAGAEPDDQSLELATVADMNGNKGAGSVHIRTRQLVDMLVGLPNPWLLTLNCCHGGAAAAEMSSMAHQLVGAGFPAAVAMTEQVDSRDAHEFTRAFYRALLAELQQAAAQVAAQGHVDFEFAHAMHGARSALCDLHEGDSRNAREWVLPVLYVRGADPLRFVSPPPMPAAQLAPLRERAAVVAAWLKQVQASLDEAGRLQVMNTMLAGVPAEFWPDVHGNFAQT